MITRLEIDGFKSFVDFKMDVPPFFAIVGANASGKSNLFEAITLMARLIAEPSGKGLMALGGRGRLLDQFHTYANGEPVDSMRIAADVEMKVITSRLDFGACSVRVVAKIPRTDPPKLPDPDVTVEILPRADGRRLPTKYKGSSPLPDRPLSLRGLLQRSSEPRADIDVLAGIGGCLVDEAARWRTLLLDPVRMRAPGDLFDTDRLVSDGSNIAAVLGRMHQNPDFTEFRADGAALIPGLLDVHVIRDDRRRVWEFDARFQGRADVPAELASEGTLRVLGLLAAVHDAAPDDVLMIEEIENGLNPNQVPQLISRLREIVGASEGGRGPQVLMTSHSPIVTAALLNPGSPALVFFESARHPAKDGRTSSSVTRARWVTDTDGGLRIPPAAVRRQLDALLQGT